MNEGINLQHISIKNLGPIKELEFDINKINIVIGESAVGKSTLAKAIYLFKNLKTEIIKHLSNMLLKRHLPTLDELYTWIVSTVNISFSHLFYLKPVDCPGLFIRYQWNSESTITLVNYHKSISLDTGTILKVLYSNFQKIYSSVDKLSNTAVQNGVGIDLIPDIVETVFGEKQYSYYVPANRNAIIDFSSAIIQVGTNNIDTLAGTYFKQIESIKSFFRFGIDHIQSQTSKKILGIEQTIQDILGGKYIYNNGFELFVLNDGFIISLAALSSGQKDTLWLLYQLYYLLSIQQDSFVIIEEPESHIFTSLQKKIMDVIVFFANQKGNSVFVTTHSPYILLAANTMFYAGHFANKKDAAEAIVGKDMSISKDTLTAVQLSLSGSKNLIDFEEHELHTSYIDAADDIHSNYDRLLDLEDYNDT